MVVQGVACLFQTLQGLKCSKAESRLPAGTKLPPSPGWWEAPPGDREAARKPQTPKGSDSWSTWSLVSQVRATVPHGSHSPSLEGAGKVRPLAGKADSIQGWGHCLGKSRDGGVPLG